MKPSASRIAHLLMRSDSILTGAERAVDAALAQAEHSRGVPTEAMAVAALRAGLLRCLECWPADTILREVCEVLNEARPAGAKIEIARKDPLWRQ